MARYEHLPVYKAAMDMTIYFLVRRRVVGNVKRKIRTRRIDSQVWASYKGHFKHAQAHKLEQGLCAMLEKEGLEKVFQ